MQRIFQPLWWLLGLPYRLLWSLFYPPLPPLSQIISEDLVKSRKEILEAQRDLLRVAFEQDRLQGVIEMNERRIERLQAISLTQDPHSNVVHVTPRLHR